MNQEHAIETGDIIDVLKAYDDCVFDAVLCDPPYGLSFMGKRWDYDVPSVELWRAVHRVCKPGAPLIAFGGTRTYHRLVVNVEDAGFEIRDQLSWLYGSGFPKSLDVSKAIDAAAGVERAIVGERKGTGNKSMCGEAGGKGFGPTVQVTAPATALAAEWSGYGTALKPACEPAVLARRPLEGTVAANVAKWGVGALAIDACRIEGVKDVPVSMPTGPSASGGFMMGAREMGKGQDPNAGRWPANVILDEEAGAILDAQTGERKSTLTGKADPNGRHKNPSDALTDGWLGTRQMGGGNVYADTGGASRFFYCAKASRSERDRGCEDLPALSGGAATDRADDSAGTRNPRAGAGRTGGARNFHPTVKPLALCEYLARLIMPPKPDAILVPFSGSGSEMIGALRAGWPLVVGVERDPDYVGIAERRIAAAVAAITAGKKAA